MSDVKNVNENTLLDKDTANIHELENAETGANAQILSDEVAAQTYVLDKKRTSINYDNATKIASSGRVSDSEKSKITSIAGLEASEIRQKAECAEMDARHLLRVPGLQKCAIRED